MTVTQSDLAVDVAVIGAGAAGIAAAVAAARAGAKTILVEPAAGPAGTVVRSGLTTLCGLYLSDGLDQPEFVNDGLPKEIAEALMQIDGVKSPETMGRVSVLPYRPESFARIAGRLIQAEFGLTPMWDTKLENADVEKGRIKSLLLRGPQGDVRVEVGAAIDATGFGALARIVGEPTLEQASSRLTPAVVFPLAPVEFNAASPAEMVRLGLQLTRAMESGDLEPGPASLSINKTPDPGTVTGKLNLGDVRKWLADDGPQALALWADRRVRLIVEFLRREIHGFENCRLPERRLAISPREGHCVQGRYILTGADVLAARKFDGAACRGCWPIEEWDDAGRPRLRYPPRGEAYDIPLDALRSARLENLFFAGKCMSADAEALASTRVIGCCLATGEAASRAAAG